MQRRRFLLLYGAAWLAMACIFGVLIQASSTPMPVAVVVIAGINNATPGALLGLIAWWLAMRLAERGWPTVRFVAVHLLLALAYTVLWSGAIVAILAVVSPEGLADFIGSGGVGWQLMGGGLFYIVLAGIAHGRFITVRNHELAAAAARSEALRIHAELQALRARLDPHFLFNALHSIMALVRREPAAGERALERLGDLLRRVLALNQEPAEELPLADELDFIRDCLALESLRLGDRLTVIEDVDPDALDCLLPVLTLQPLVENAIRHAIAPRTAGGTLRIAAHLEQDTLCVEVEDDGPGLPATRAGSDGIGAGPARRPHGDETLRLGVQGDRPGIPARIASPASTAGAADGPGIGVRLVRQRLEARHGDAARLDLLPGAAGGLRARITIPARTIPVHALAEAP